MMELIDYIDHMQNVYIKKSKETKDKNYQKGVEAILTATTLIKIQAKYNLEKEKEQMIDFGYKCRNKCKKESKLLPQDIFNTTYNQ